MITDHPKKTASERSVFQSVWRLSPRKRNSFALNPISKERKLSYTKAVIITMQILKENYYSVIKLWINQFGSMFLALLLLLPSAGALAPSWLMPAVSAYTVLFYLALIFFVTCEMGLNDSVSIETGKTPKKWYKGTVIALAANTPSLLASIIACISKALLPGIDFLAPAEGASGVAASIYSVSAMINDILHIMYKGLLNFFGIDHLPFIYLPLALLSVTVCTLGYLAGSKGMFASFLSKKRKN